MSCKKYILIASATLALTTPTLAGVFVDFNGDSDPIPTHFAGNGQALPVWGSANGLAGSGAVDVATANYGNFQGVQISGTPEDFSTLNAKLTVSAFFRIDAPPPNTPSDARLLDLYLTEASSTNVAATGAGNAHVGMRLNTTSNNTTYRLGVRNNNGNGTLGSTFGLTVGHWHKLTVDFTNTDPGAGSVDLDVTIDNYGASGAAFVSNVITDTTTFSAINTVMTGDSAVYSAFRIPRGDNLSSLDNFSFVPEPGALGLLMVGGLAALARRRR